MAVYRVAKTQNYSVISNYHLRDMNLSLKAKGLLSLMLSLPDGWDYTTKGLAKICKDGIDSIRTTVKELETYGYIQRKRIRNAKGQMTTTEYTILEQPVLDSPRLENPILDKPRQEKPAQEKPTQLNTKESSTEEINTDSLSIDSFPSFYPESERNGTEGYSASIETYRDLIQEQIDYDLLADEMPSELEQLDGVVELLAETLASTKDTIRVAGNDFPQYVVKGRLYKLTADHVRFVFDCLKENTSKIRNMKQYLLTSLFNAPITMDSYYAARVNHDLYGGKT